MATAWRRLPVRSRVRRIACLRPVDAVGEPPDLELASEVVCVHDADAAPDVDDGEPETCETRHQRGRRRGAGHDFEVVDAGVVR